MRYVLVLTLISGALAAQSIAWSPAYRATSEGNSNNTIPFWAQSGTYMQVHDHADMVDVMPVPLPMNGIWFRKDAGVSSAVTGRMLEVQMTVSNTPVSSQTATNDFAANLGAGATLVLPFTPVNFPGLTNMSSPNPPGWNVPWMAPFVHVPAPGNNFCWEWRHRNSTDFSIAAMDTDDGQRAVATLEGTGCLVAGQTRNASITTRSLTMGTGAFRNRLQYASASAPGVLAFGAVRTNIQLPGMCAPLLVNPLLTMPGSTDAIGEWDFNITAGSLLGIPPTELLSQFVWVDPALPVGLGLSDLSVLTTPERSAQFRSRFYAAPFQGGPGNELAQFATGITRSYALVVGFATP